MRILHTSDWHLGRSLHGVDLLQHQAAYLEHLVEVCRSEQVDAVLVAGDIFDRAIPPVGAVQLLSEALARLSEVAAVVLTPGNHDSAARLGFTSQLLRPGLHIRALADDAAAPVLLPRRDGQDGALVYGIPYLEPDDARFRLAPSGGEPLARSHAAVLGAVMDRVRSDLATRQRIGPPVPSVVMAHAFVVGGTASDSERDIRVGGVDSVPAGTFRGVDYVALGHLHGPQRLGASDGVLARYSGSPLAYSFSEMNHRKSSVLFDLAAGGAPELIAAPVPRRLSEVRGSLAEVLGAQGEPHIQDWVRVVVTDAVRPENLVARVREQFPHALVVLHSPAVAGSAAEIREVAPAADPVEVCCDFVAHVRDTAPDAAELAVLRSAVEQANKGLASA